MNKFVHHFTILGG